MPQRAFLTRRPEHPAPKGSSIDRREFSRWVGSALLGLYAGRLRAATHRRAQKEVLVVGAGIAGLAAARRLADAGHIVRVVEARDRIGGRIFTSSQWSDIPLDLGASWIHGATGNPITALANTVGARTATTDYDSGILYGTDGMALDAQENARLVQLQGQVNGVIVAGQDGDVDRPLVDTVEDGMGIGQLSAQDQRFVRFAISEIEQEYAGSASDLSTYWFDDGQFFSGDEVIFLDGYRVIVDHLAAGLILDLGQTVTRIETTASGVRVSTQAGHYDVDQVIVTLPLGVLKSGAVQFVPGLPTAMQSAVDTLHMGVLNKCYLRFPSAFWPTQLDWLAQVPAQQGRWTNWLSFARPLGQPVLVGFNAADFGRELESWSDEAIVASGMASLRSIFGQAIPDPLGFQITRWGADPYALGSYSFMTTGSHPSMRDALAGDIEGKIFFAGEATSRHYASTVHGAYLSGLEAAQKIGGSGLIFADGLEGGDTSAWGVVSGEI